jgi:transcriptional regulator with PAS, ATPase and Fis domain
MKRRDGFFKRLLDNMQIGIIVSDAEGFLIYINETYARFLNIDIEASIGKHATEVIANSRLHIVAKTGIPEINYPHKFKDTGFLVHRVPIKKDGAVEAVLGLVLFDSAITATNLAEKVTFLETKLKRYQKELSELHSTRYRFDHVIGCSERIRRVRDEARHAASNDLPVLITGESGTGKELFAQAIHHASARRDYPFVRVNCAAMPRDLLEAELFGYEKGSFTGADPRGKPGKFEIAHMGTIFLDEIGDMPLEIQPKLLRVLELKEFERLGGTVLQTSDFRVIAATNQNLDRLMKSGQFRRDLYYRISGLPIIIPPLRNRREDILPMAYYFIQQTIRGPAGKGIRIKEEAERKLLAYDWPGNGRQLLHVLQRILYTQDPESIEENHLPDYIRETAPIPEKRKETGLAKYLKNAEKLAIEEALRRADGNKTRAARALGIHRTLLYRKIRLLGIR